MNGRDREISSSLTLRNHRQEAIGVDIDGIDATPLIEEVYDSANPSCFAVLATTDRFFESRLSCILSRRVY